MDTRRELQQVMWEVIAARLQGDDGQALRLVRIAWRLFGVLDGGLSGGSDRGV